jgi:hypothetical protein
MKNLQFYRRFYQSKRLFVLITVTLLIFTQIILSYNICFAANDKQTPELATAKKSASFIWNHGKDSFSFGVDWFLKGDFSWAKRVNDFITKHINEIVAMPFSFIVAIIEIIFNFIFHYTPAILILIYAIVVMVFGALFFPIIWLWNMFLDIFTRN